ncbi:MAG: GatB/YqeY domain-containing protein [Bacteroidia bacterium]|nr:GatB/YqeY domain-containing protein [Bacteroidia bacterium]MCZ2277852.1 GatB/YqeY domain-containing protein [Bacteroidia bacterium]
MSLEQTIQSELKAAMLNKDEAALRALRAVKSAILLIKTSGAEKEISEEAETKILQKLIKQRRESAGIYYEQGRDDLAKAEEDEIAIIEKFLPAQMSETEIIEVLKKIISDYQIINIAQSGKVMGVAARQLAGRADNKLVASLLKQLLS